MKRTALFIGIPAVALLALLVVAMPGSAEVTGGCTGTINGQAIRSAAITVPENGTVAYMFTAPNAVTSWNVELVYAGTRTQVDQGTSEAGEFTIGGNANVKQYAKYGVGLYQLVGTIHIAGGDTCTGNIDIVVQGNPLATVMGAAGAGAAVLGGAGATAASVASAKAAAAAVVP